MLVSSFSFPLISSHHTHPATYQPSQTPVHPAPSLPGLPRSGTPPPSSVSPASSSPAPPLCTGTCSRGQSVKYHSLSSPLCLLCLPILPISTSFLLPYPLFLPPPPYFQSLSSLSHYLLPFSFLWIICCSLILNVIYVK